MIQMLLSLSLISTQKKVLEQDWNKPQGRIKVHDLIKKIQGHVIILHSFHITLHHINISVFKNIERYTSKRDQLFDIRTVPSYLAEIAGFQFLEVHSKLRPREPPENDGMEAKKKEAP